MHGISVDSSDNVGNIADDFADSGWDNYYCFECFRIDFDFDNTDDTDYLDRPQSSCVDNSYCYCYLPWHIQYYYHTLYLSYYCLS